MTKLLRAWRSVRRPAQFAALVVHLAARLGLHRQLGRGLPPAQRSRLMLVPLVPLVAVLDLDLDLDVANPYSVLLVHRGEEEEEEEAAEEEAEEEEDQEEEDQEEEGRRMEGSHSKYSLGGKGGGQGGCGSAAAALLRKGVVLRDLCGTEAAMVSTRMRHDLQRYHARATGATAPPPLGRGPVGSPHPPQQSRHASRGASRRSRCGAAPAAPAAPPGVPAAHGGRPRPQRPPAAAAPASAAPDGRQMRALLRLRSRQQRHAHAGREAALWSYLWPLACAALGLLVFGWVAG